MSVLLTGVGPMGIAYARVLNAIGVDYLAVGRGEASAKAFQEHTNAEPVLGGLGAFLETNGGNLPASAILALPVPDLAAAAMDLMKRGVKHLLVEKPAGIDLEEIRDVVHAGDTSGAQVFVAYNRRYYASVSAARHMIDEDGGVTSFQFEFTEVSERVLMANKDPRVLENWFLANSSHVIDLAFHLGGNPVKLSASTAGALGWHPPGAVFTGSGKTDKGALFSYHADWSSAGRWGVDICTPKRRLILRPLEELKVQPKGSFAIEEVALDDALDKEFKPGLYLQVKDFLSGNASGTLPSIGDHAEAAQLMFAMRDGTGIPDERSY